jgi:uncharacterized RDD family membrane protein YckC
MSIDPFEGAILNDPASDNPTNAEPNIRYAGFWIRFVASLIDSILIMVIVFPIIEFFFANKSSVSTSIFDARGFSTYSFESMSTLSGTGQLVYIIVTLLILLLFWTYRSATPGKMLLGIKIVDAKTRQPISKGQGIVRYLGYYVSTLFFCLGFIWAGLDPRKQAWHDKMAGTLVVYEDKKVKSPE